MMMSTLYILIAGLTAYWVYQDAQKRSMSSLWAIGTFFMPLLFLLLYFIFRKPLTRQTEPEEDIVRVCYKCEKRLQDGDRYCPRCGVDTQNPKPRAE
jgi:phosphotransferase system  glucose/maltose/N-acetylglucosamine-specific IIC component